MIGKIKSKSKKKKSYSDEEIIAHLESLKVNDKDNFHLLDGILQAIKMNGSVSNFAKKAGTTRENIYKCLEPNHKHYFTTIHNILHDLGCTFQVEPKK